MNEKKINANGAQGANVAEKGTEETPIIKINAAGKDHPKILSFEEISEKVERLSNLKAKRERLNSSLKTLKSFKIENADNDDEGNERAYQELTITDSNRVHYSIKNANTIQHIINVIQIKTEQAVQEVEKQLVAIF
jgi:hypothetical protein